MSLVSPGTLVWLIPILGVIVLLYMLRMRRKDLSVPATFLWPQLTSEVRANALFQKLRWNLLMVLQLIAAALVILGLARPQVRHQGVNGQTTVVVVDASASMSARDGSPTRLDEAKKRAGTIIEALRPGDQVCLIESGPIPRVVCPLSGDIGRLRAGISTIHNTDSGADMGEALRLATSIVGKRDQARIVVISDGVFQKVTNLSIGKAELVYSAVGSRQDNLSIAALGCSGTQAFVSVKNHGLDAKSTTVRLYADGSLINSFQLQVPSHQTSGKISVVPSDAKLVEAKIDSDDMLPADNSAATLASGSTGIKVLIVGPTDFFLERALTIDPRVTVDRATELPESAKKGGYDIVIFDGVAEKSVQAKGVIVIGAGNGSIKRPVAEQLAQHPLMDGVSLEGVYIDSAKEMPLGKEDIALAGAESQPLIVAREGQTREVRIGFRLADSDFPLQVGFPIFVANALDWLAPTESNTGTTVVSAGRPFSMRVATDGAVSLKNMDNGAMASVTPHNKLAVIRETTQAGHYTFDGRPIIANFGDKSESDIAPQDTLSLAGKPTKAAGSVFILADYWRTVLFVVLLVLAAEWWLFMRKS